MDSRICGSRAGRSNFRRCGFSTEPTHEGLRRALEEIHRQFQLLSPAFFEEAENKLLSSRLLQLALAEARSTAPNELAGNHEALAAAKYILPDLEHPAYLRLRTKLQEAWTSEVPEAERRMSNAIACACLELAWEEQRAIAGNGVNRALPIPSSLSSRS